MIAEELTKEILERRERRLVSDAKIYPKNHPTASQLGECDREMVLAITNWRDRPPFKPYVQARIEEGKKQENRIIQELLDLGFTITENNPPPFEIRDRQGRLILRGMIDGKCRWQEKKIPFEIKSVDKQVFNRLENVEDFNRFWWMRKYILQMQAYLYANNEEYGLFILVDMAGHWKIFITKLDLELMEKILQRCGYVVDCVEKNEFPDYFKNISICKKCWAFGRVCTPPLDFGEGTQIVDDPEMADKLKEWDTLRNNSKRFDKLDKEIKDYFRDRPNCICGDYTIAGKKREPKGWIIQIELLKEN